MNCTHWPASVQIHWMWTAHRDQQEYIFSDFVLPTLPSRCTVCLTVYCTPWPAGVQGVLLWTANSDKQVNIVFDWLWTSHISFTEVLTVHCPHTEFKELLAQTLKGTDFLIKLCLFIFIYIYSSIFTTFSLFSFTINNTLYSLNFFSKPDCDSPLHSLGIIIQSSL